MEDTTQQAPPASQTENPPPPPPMFEYPIAPPPMPQFAPPQKQRRVGTFTLGLTLIFIGIVIPLTMMFKDNALFILQFSPVVLVMLGIEVLIYAFRYKEGKLKYDGFSIFLVIFLTVVSIGTASITPMITTYLKNERLVSNEAYTAETAVKKAMRSNGIDGNFNAYSDNIYYYYSNGFWFGELNEDKLVLVGNMSVMWEDSENIPTEQEIISKIAPVLKDIDYPLAEVDLEIIFRDRSIAYATVYGEDMKSGEFKVRFRKDIANDIADSIAQDIENDLQNDFQYNSQQSGEYNNNAPTAPDTSAAPTP